MKREFSAGGLVYKSQATNPKSQVLWLIRRPTPNPEYRGNLGWSWPKGWIDQGENLETAALREVREEVGVKARIIRKLPTIKVWFVDQDHERVMKFITYFVMEWESDLEEGFGEETVETRWVTYNEAMELLVHRNEKKLLELAVGMK